MLEIMEVSPVITTAAFYPAYLKFYKQSAAEAPELLIAGAIGASVVYLHDYLMPGGGTMMNYLMPILLVVGFDMFIMPKIGASLI
jgi:hypothetical protein